MIAPDFRRTVGTHPQHLARASLAAVALAVLAPQIVLGQQTPPPDTAALSLEQAVSLARENNPNYLAQRNDIDVARWQVRSAQFDFLPSASISNSFGYTASGERRFGSVGFGEQPAIYSSSYDLGLSLNLSGAKLLQPAVARAQVRATRQRVEGAEATLTANVAQQYLSVLQGQEAVAQAEREVARTGEYVRLAQARFEVGAGTPLDVRRAEVQQGQAEIRLVQARNTLATATLQLGQLIGTPLEPGQVRLSSKFALFEPNLNADALVDASIRNNPNLLAARATASAAHTGVQQARSAYLPSLALNFRTSGSVYEAETIDPFVQQDLAGAARSYQSCLDQNRIRQMAGLTPNLCLNPTDPTVVSEIQQRYRDQYSGFPFGYVRQPWSAALTVSLPLFTGLSRTLQLQQAKANAEDARYQARAQELQLRADVAAAARNVRTAYETAVIQERVRATAAEELRLAQERFRFGAASSVEVTDAQTNLGEAERAQIDAVYNFHQSLAALEALVGQPLRSPSAGEPR